jgi:ankyrin repeat protein
MRRLLEWLAECLLYLITRVLSLLCSGEIIHELFVQCRQSAADDETTLAASSSLSVLHEIQNLVKDFPGAIKARNKDGVCPLDVACLYGAPMEVVQFLAERHPVAVKIRYKSGQWWQYTRWRSNATTTAAVHRRLPLHYACRGKASMDVIRYLLELEPDAIKAPGLRGMLPLHEACRSNTRRSESETLKVIQYLVSKYPDAVRTADMEWGFLPLHAALGRCPGRFPSVMKFLIQRYPKALTIETKTGQLPLHLACARETPVEVIQCMVKQYNASIVARDNRGKLPLEIACRCPHASADVMAAIVSDAWGDDYPPLHFACIHHASLETIQYLCTMPLAASVANSSDVDCIVSEDHHEPAAQSAGPDRLLPLHCACRAGNATTVPVIEFLYKRYPQAIQSLDNAKGELPLHIACRRKANLDIITSLVQKNSDALLIPNRMGYLPLHLAILHEAPAATIFFLMSEHPDALLFSHNSI